VVFPFLMRRRPDPLVPLGLFRSRHFTVTNISTFLIYGALYVYFYYLALFTQGTLGYTAVAAGLVGLPGGLLLTLFSPRFGTLAARLGPRRFMAAGPVVMALGLLWLARTPVDSVGWQLQPGDVGTWLPSSGYLIDLLPSVLLFGAGITMLVAPLTTALMRSVPMANAGLASAINNAISRVGPQLVGAVIFVGITALFYANLATLLPGTDVAALRHTIAPLDVPPLHTPPDIVAAAHRASTDAFHLAMLVCAGLLLVGAAVNAFGIRPFAAAPSPEPDTPSGSAVAG
jgi:MFS family permease